MSRYFLPSAEMRCPHCGSVGYGAGDDAPYPLTKRQREIFDFIAGVVHRDGYAPSFEEIAAQFGYRSLATVHEHLTILESKGWIKRRFNMSRGIQILASEAA